MALAGVGPTTDMGIIIPAITMAAITATAGVGAIAIIGTGGIVAGAIIAAGVAAAGAIIVAGVIADGAADIITATGSISDESP